jgi:hypothetical protein
MPGRAGTLNFVDDLAMEQGATFDGSLAFTNDDGTPVDLTGYTIVWQIRTQTVESALILNMALYCAVPAPTGGVVNFNVPRTITAALIPGTYETDFMLTLGTYGRFEFRGTFIIVDTVSQV